MKQLFTIIVLALLASCYKPQATIDATITKQFVRVAIRPGVDALQEMWVAGISSNEPITNNVTVTVVWDIYIARKTDTVLTLLESRQFEAVYTSAELLHSTGVRTPEPREFHISEARNVHVTNIHY